MHTEYKMSKFLSGGEKQLRCTFLSEVLRKCKILMYGRNLKVKDLKPIYCQNYIRFIYAGILHLATCQIVWFSLICRWSDGAMIRVFLADFYIKTAALKGVDPVERDHSNASVGKPFVILNHKYNCTRIVTQIRDFSCAPIASTAQQLYKLW